MQTKFKRIQSDWGKISGTIEAQSDDLSILSKQMLEEHEIHTRIISTLVEVEFMQ